MIVETDAIRHLSLLFVISMIIFPLKRSCLVVLLLVIPPIIEFAQFFMPDRVPDVMDAFHGYLGILLAYCLIRMWHELLPTLKKFRPYFESRKLQKQGNMR